MNRAPAQPHFPGVRRQTLDDTKQRDTCAHHGAGAGGRCHALGPAVEFWDFWPSKVLAGRSVGGHTSCISHIPLPEPTFPHRM